MLTAPDAKVVPQWPQVRQDRRFPIILVSLARPKSYAGHGMPSAWQETSALAVLRPLDVARKSGPACVLTLPSAQLQDAAPLLL